MSEKTPLPFAVTIVLSAALALTFAALTVANFLGSPAAENRPWLWFLVASLGAWAVWDAYKRIVARAERNNGTTRLHRLKPFIVLSMIVVFVQLLNMGGIGT